MAAVCSAASRSHFPPVNTHCRYLKIASDCISQLSFDSEDQQREGVFGVRTMPIMRTQQATSNIADYIVAFYNNIRLQLKLGNSPPNAFELELASKKLIN